MAAKEREREAAYQTVARELREALLGQRYADGNRLPTEAELSVQYAVSRQTVRRAFQELVAEGMVHRVPGRGTFATEHGSRYLRQFGSVEDLMSLSLDTDMEVLSPLRRRVDIEAAGRLQLDSDAVYEVVFRRLHGGAPFCVTTVRLRPYVGQALGDAEELAAAGARSSFTIIGLIEARLRIPVLEADQSITATAADASTAELLGCRPGDPLLRIDRLYCTTGSEPLEQSTSYFLPEQYTYRVRLRRGVR